MHELYVGPGVCAPFGEREDVIHRRMFRFDPGIAQSTHTSSKLEHSCKLDCVIAFNTQHSCTMTLPEADFTTFVPFTDCLKRAVDLATVFTISSQSIFRVGGPVEFRDCFDVHTSDTTFLFSHPSRSRLVARATRT